MVGTMESTQSTMLSFGSSIANFDLFSEPPPLAATITSTVSPGTSSTCTTAGVLSPVFLRLPSGSASIDARSLLSSCGVGAAHALVDHLLQAHLRVPAHVHADADEGDRDPRVLTDRTVALGAHARVDEDLRHRILRGG